MKRHKLPTSVDLSRCILWQYQNARRLQRMVGLFQDGAEIASTDLWKKTFYAFNLDKPISSTDPDYQIRMHGLLEISNLFGLSRPSYKDSSGTYHVVSDNAWRRYIKGMIWLMDSDGSASDINKWLSIIFNDNAGTKKVVDNLNMTIRYEFPAYEEGSDEYQMINTEGFLPHPAGVLLGNDIAVADDIFGLEYQYEVWWPSLDDIGYSYDVGDIVIKRNFGSTPYWTSGTSYSVGDTVIHAYKDNRVTFFDKCVCTTANSDVTFTPSKWDITVANAQSRTVYICNTSTPGATWISGSWTQIPSWASGTSYSANDHVIYTNEFGNKHVFKCKTANSDTKFDYAKWDKIVVSRGQMNLSRFGYVIRMIGDEDLSILTTIVTNGILEDIKKKDIGAAIQELKYVDVSTSTNELRNTINSILANTDSSIYDFSDIDQILENDYFDAIANTINAMIEVMFPESE